MAKLSYFSFFCKITCFFQIKLLYFNFSNKITYFLSLPSISTKFAYFCFILLILIMLRIKLFVGIIFCSNLRKKFSLIKKLDYLFSHKPNFFDNYRMLTFYDIFNYRIKILYFSLCLEKILCSIILSILLSKILSKLSLYKS